MPKPQCPTMSANLTSTQPPTASTDSLHITTSSLHSIPKNLLKLLPQHPNLAKGAHISVTDQLLHTVQQLHHHALKLHRSLYLHSLHLKEKDDLLIRFRTQNQHATSKLKQNMQKWKTERQLYLSKLGESWIRMAEKLGRMDLLEDMEHEWKRVDDDVKREMNSLTPDALQTPQTPTVVAQSAAGPTASEDTQPTIPSSGGLAPRSFTARSKRGPFGMYRSQDEPSSPIASNSSTQKLQIVDTERKQSTDSNTTPTSLDRSALFQNEKDPDQLVQSLKDEGTAFDSDTHLVGFLKKYAAEGFLEPPADILEDSEEYRLLRERARVDEMTMTDEMLTQWLWIFENDPDLQEKIRRQNRFAGIVASSELDLWNKKYGDGANDDDDARGGKKGRFRVNYGDDDPFGRGRNGGEDDDGDAAKNGANAFGKLHRNNYDELFDPDDPANPNHPDHLAYMKSLQDKAAELERLRAEFEKQKQLLKKRNQELNELKTKPKYTSDIDERALMEKLYDYRRMIQDRDEEILRLREALRDREKRKLKRNGKLNVFEFIALDDLYEMKLSDITDSSRCVRHPDVMHARPHTALAGSRVNPSSLIKQPKGRTQHEHHHDDSEEEDDEHKENHPHDTNGLDVSSIRPENETGLDPWSGIREDSTFVTSMRAAPSQSGAIQVPTTRKRPHTALAGKIHPSTAPMIKEAQRNASSFATSVQPTRSTSPTIGSVRQRFNISVSPPRAPSTNLSFGDTALYEVKPRPRTASTSAHSSTKVPFAGKVKTRRRQVSSGELLEESFKAAHHPPRRMRPQTASYSGGAGKKSKRRKNAVLGPQLGNDEVMQVHGVSSLM